MAGPFCCMLLGDLGADVIKVEPPEGDQARQGHGIQKLKGDDSLGFLNMNRNKRSIYFLDLKSEAGRNVFFRLAETADVIVERTIGPGAMKKLGVDYEAARAVNPGVIYASIFWIRAIQAPGLTGPASTSSPRRRRERSASPAIRPGRPRGLGCR